jgi:hypothetical protein
VRFLVHLLVALSYIPVRLSIVLLGLVLVPLALWYYDRTGRWPWLLKTWHNPEDPVWDLPSWYAEHYAPAHWAAKRFPRFWWFAVRNPANGMRTWFKPRATYKDIKWRGSVDPVTARANGGSVFRYRYSGLLAEFWYIRAWNPERHFRFRLGWKLGQPLGENALGYALQLMPYRKG